MQRLSKAEGGPTPTIRPQEALTAWRQPWPALVATDGEIVIGFLRALTDGAVTMYIAKVLVDAPWRGKGIGHILDWDGAMLAPPERDLFLFTGEHFPTSLRYYEQEYGPVHVDGDVFGFYFYRCNLEDLTDWIVRVLYENADDEQDESDLEGIRKDCLEWWPALEADIGVVKSPLIAKGTPSALAHKNSPVCAGMPHAE